MTTAELHKSFEIGLDKHGSPSILPEEKDLWLNKAYIMLINQKFNGSTPSGMGFEDSEKRISDLAKLIKTATNSDMSCVNSPSVGAKAVDFLYFVNGFISYRPHQHADVQVSSTVIPIKHEEAVRFMNTANNQPVITNPVMTQIGNNFNIYFDKYTVFPISTNKMAFTYNYISMPEKIDHTKPNESPLIAEHTHHEIVALAVLLAIENIESQRLQGNLTTLTIQE